MFKGVKHKNKTNDKFYEIVKKNIKYTKEELQQLLDSYIMSCFYSNNEIDKIKEEFIM